MSQQANITDMNTIHAGMETVKLELNISSNVFCIILLKIGVSILIRKYFKKRQSIDLFAFKIIGNVLLICLLNCIEKVKKLVHYITMVIFENELDSYESGKVMASCKLDTYAFCSANAIGSH